VGGTAETVDHGRTGVLFPAGDFDALAAILRDVDFDRFEPTVLRASTDRFRSEVFRARLVEEVERIFGGVSGVRPSPERLSVSAH
jgi:glycosyltransferase involved in cell wall biosynthesis